MFIKKIFYAVAALPALLAITYSPLAAATYYFSETDGDDRRSFQLAQNPATPWRSLEKLNAVFKDLKAGDSVLLKRNDVFRGQIQVTASGTPAKTLVIASYGLGDSPVISGLTSLVHWTARGNGVWESEVDEQPASIHTVLVNNSPKAVGRYPNANAANGGWLSIQSVPSQNQVVVNAVPPTTDLGGGEIVIRKTHWVTDRNPIVTIVAGTIQYISQSGYGASPGYGCFFQNYAATLDQEGEWFYNKQLHRLGMYFGTGGPGTSKVDISVVDELLTVNNQHNIELHGLTLKGANAFALGLSGCNNITIDSCSMLFNGMNAVRAIRCSGLSILNSLINYSNNNACEITETTKLLIRGSAIHNSGTVSGSGEGDSGSYEALLLSGNGQVIENNTIKNTGYIPITFNGSDISIKNNLIDSFGYTKDDGGGIYTWNNTSPPVMHNNRRIDGNIVLNGIGAPEGTADKKSLIHGIYMDDNADQLIIKNNTVASCAQYGLYLHNAHDIQLDSNTMYNNGSQMAFVHDQIAAGSPIRNIHSTNNIFFSKTDRQQVAILGSIENDLQLMGEFDYNFYCRPLEEQHPFQLQWKDGNGIYDFDGWKQISGQDGHSKQSPVRISLYKIISFNGGNLFANGSFNSDVNGLYAFSAAGNASIAWAPNSPLDNGALKISFSNFPAVSGHASIITGLGAIHGSQDYVVSYDIAAATALFAENYLRKSLSPYTDLSERKLGRVRGNKVHINTFLRSVAADNNASLGIDVDAQTEPVYLDNVSIRPATLQITSPDDSIKFFFNPNTTEKAIILDGAYVDARGHFFNGLLTLAAFRSAVLIRQSMVALPIVFKAFNAVKKERSVVLSWTLGGAVTGDLIDLQRSTEGQSFTTLKRDSITMTLADTLFGFMDSSPAASNYYRLRYGTSRSTLGFSKTIRADFGNNAYGERFVLHPNPVYDKLFISVDEVAFSKPTLLIKSTDGKLLKKTTMDSPHSIINVSQFPKGTYLITLFSNGTVTTKKFEKL